MKQKLQGLITGMLIGTTITGSVAFATTGTKSIEVLYNNIKVYKDNVLCELKDANGTVIEPFIYNGTTYMPVRGAANLAGMNVEWDGATQSVYLWDELPMDGTYLLDVCPPYEISKYYEAYMQADGKSFKMAGNKFSNGFTLGSSERYAIFNLNGKYSNIEFTIGRLDGGSMINTTVSFFLDNKLIKEVYVKAEGLPQTVKIPVEHGLQLKILTSNNEGGGADIGFGNVTVK